MGYEPLCHHRISTAPITLILTGSRPCPQLQLLHLSFEQPKLSLALVLYFLKWATTE
jgi:hypothetical protein